MGRALVTTCHLFAVVYYHKGHRIRLIRAIDIQHIYAWLARFTR